MVRTGRPLGEVLGAADQSPDARGIVQPILDPYTELLPEMLEMSEQPAMAPYRSVVDYFPVGSAQPAWVAILRGGRVLVQSDGDRGARIFLPGESAHSAYDLWYPVIRHALSSLARVSGDTLRVAVYAYRHRYSRSELELNPRPWLISAARFPVPAGKIPLDLSLLAAFFQGDMVPGGAAIDDRAGLLLDPALAELPTLSGYPVTLADLAVAYRAVSRAGDNEAFISLDPNPDPTAATVSFGGFLEHTHIGATVLEADKRFKTITCGLDPNSFQDVRSLMSFAHPGFYTSAERDIATDAMPSGKWIGTRFWFYPESIEIETDPEYRTATVVNAQFTADAERQRDDFADPAAFERFKRRSLSSSIRDCIDDLNRNYELYAAVFPELAELKNVARLFGICSWLKRGRGARLDLDALLSVDVPAYITPETKPQLIVANWAYAPSDTRMTASLTRARLKTEYLTPLLDMTIREFFGDAAALEGFIRAKASAPGNIMVAEESATFFSEHGNDPVRSLVRKMDDLQILAKLFMQNAVRGRMDRIRNEESGLDEGLGRVRLMEQDIARMRSELDQERDSIVRLQTSVEEMKRAGIDNTPRFERDVAEHNRLVEQHNARQNSALAKQHEYRLLVDELNRGLEKFAREASRTYDVLSIGGGINLGPQQFRIRVKPGRRAEPMRGPVNRGGEAAPPIVQRGGGRERARGGAEPAASRPPVTVAAGSPRERSDAPASPSSRVPVRSSWAMPEIVTTLPRAAANRDDYKFRSGDGAWQDNLVLSPGNVRVRSFDEASRTLVIRVATPAGEKGIVAQKRADGRIVFRRSGDSR